jgi:hypothetical protein
LQAWRELCRIEREQERLSAMRAEALNDLEKSRQRASILEQVTRVRDFLLLTLFWCKMETNRDT